MRISSPTLAGVWIGAIASLCGTLSVTARADGNAPVVGDPVTAALVDAALRHPDVANAIHAGAASGNAASSPPMIELTTRTPSPVILPGPGAPAQPPAASPDPRSDRHFGVDFRAGAPLGVGAEFRYTIVAPITLGAAIDTSAATYSVSAEATVNILPIFMNSHWTPTVTIGFSHLRFTGLADSAIHAFNPYLAQQGAQMHMAGNWMNLVSVMGGVDYVSDGGFHFNISAGRIMQVGDSGGGPENGAVLRNFYSYMVEIALGYQF